MARLLGAKGGKSGRNLGNHVYVWLLPGEGDYNKSCINKELKQSELTNGSSCGACMVPAGNNSILC